MGTLLAAYMLTVTLPNFDLSFVVFKEQSLARFDNISIQDHHTKLKNVEEKVVWACSFLTWELASSTK